MNKFRIVRNKLSEEGEKAFHPLRYRIEQRHTILCFIHWWSTPTFPPPHNFEKYDEAVHKILDKILEEVGDGNSKTIIGKEVQLWPDKEKR